MNEWQVIMIQKYFQGISGLHVKELGGGIGLSDEAYYRPWQSPKKLTRIGQQLPPNN